MEIIVVLSAGAIVGLNEQSHFKYFGQELAQKMSAITIITTQSGILVSIKIHIIWGFPGGAVVENPPPSAGNTCSIPGPGRSHMPRSN